jgi:hypothetical protein
MRCVLLHVYYKIEVVDPFLCRLHYPTCTTLLPMREWPSLDGTNPTLQKLKPEGHPIEALGRSQNNGVRDDQEVGTPVTKPLAQVPRALPNHVWVLGNVRLMVYHADRQRAIKLGWMGLITIWVKTWKYEDGHQWTHSWILQKDLVPHLDYSFIIHRAPWTRPPREAWYCSPFPFLVNKTCGEEP